MPMKPAAALCFGLVIFGLAAASAQAQSRQRVALDGTRYTVVDENGRTRTKIVVQKRSFLDAGTEVLPGSKPSTTNLMPFGNSPLAVIEGTNIGLIRHPLPGPYDLLGRDNPNPPPN